MNAEIFAALAQLEKERGIPQQYMIDKITQALVAAYKKDKEGYTDNVFVEVEDGDLKMYVQKEVVDDVLTPATEISLDAARKINKHAELGDLVNVDVRTQNFGRIAAQTAKQVIIQGIREAERGMIFDTFSSKEHEILTGTVLRIAPDSGDMTIRLGGNSNDRTDAMLAASEQVKGESYREGDIIRVYVVEVRRSTRGPQVIVSRTHPGLVKRLFELEVPEIASGLVEVKSIAREAGSRTKIAVCATEENIDPVGACVGTRGARVGAVVDELHGEKMDIIVWSEDPAKFVAAALSPADVVSVTVLPGTQKACLIIFAAAFVVMVIGFIPWGSFGVTAFEGWSAFFTGLPLGEWYFQEATTWFLFLAILIGIVGKLSESEIVNTFLSGAGDMMSVVMVIAVARGVSVLMGDTGLRDVQRLAEANDFPPVNETKRGSYKKINLQGMPAIVFAPLSYLLYIVLSFLIPSSSGMASASMPIMGPLAQQLGFSPEVMVQICCGGNGLVNLFTPTSGAIMGGLALARVQYSTWLKFAWKVILVIGVISIVILTGAMMIL